MAIPLKSLILERIKYFAPRVEIFKQTSDNQNPENYERAKMLFYDFYAMESLHRQLGHNPYLDDADPITKYKAAANRGVSWYDPAGGEDVVFPDSGHVLNYKFKEVIEDVFAQVTKAISDKMMVHLRLGLIQELRHLLEHSTWDNFYRAVWSAYQVQNKLTARQFHEIVEDKIPGMANELDSVVRLLKFTKAYKGTKGTSSPADIAVNAMQTGDEYDDPGPLTGHEEGVPIQIPGEDDLDTTDYAADAIEDSPYWEEEPSPSKPITADPSGYIHHGDYWNPDPGVAAYTSGDTEDEMDAYGNKKKKKTAYSFFHKKDNLTEATPAKFHGSRMSPELLRTIRQAINKSGLKWEDVDNAYNKIEWSSAFGGKTWGTGAKSYLKLVVRARDMDSHEMALLIDHIFDLMHNTGGLLNKGGMNIEDEELDRRAKCTHIARYIPLVSPTVKRIILMFLKYYPGNPEEQKDIAKITNSPHTKGFSPEQVKVLTDIGFYQYGYAYKADIIFFSKKVDKYGNRVKIGGRYYEAKAHDNGRFTIADGLKSDIQIFDTFDDLIYYINQSVKNDISKSPMSPSMPPPAAQSEKQIYITSHAQIRLPTDKEAQLLTVNMGWRPKSNYYKAYFPGAKRFYLYAFNDGSLLTTYQSTEQFKTFLDWNAAFIHISGETKDAEDYSKHSALAPAVSTAKVAPSFPSPAPETPPESPGGGLKTGEYNSLQSIAAVAGLKMGDKTISGSYAFTNPSTGKLLFSVVKSGGYKYQVWQSNNNVTIGNWTFITFDQLTGFIYTNIDKLKQGLVIPPLVISDPSVASLSTPYHELPPNAGSAAAYNMHSGLDVPPKTTIRLTDLDEGTIAALGFLPTMVGKDVYYIHGKSHDAVKFYPNNSAVINFGKGTSVKFDIPKMMTWLKQKYTKGAVSPLKTNNLASNDVKGIQAGPMFESKLVSAGFNWHPESGRYVDIKYNGKNTVFIKPNRSSIVTIMDLTTSTPETHYFANLPALTAYLSTQYQTDAQKKTDPITSSEMEPDPSASVHEPPPAPTSPNTLIFPSWVPKEVRRLMQVGKFTYSGPAVTSDDLSYRYHEDDNAQKGSQVMYIHPGQKFTVFDEIFFGQGKSPKGFRRVSDLLTKYLQPKYGKLAVPELAPGPTYPKSLSAFPSWVPSEIRRIMKEGNFVYTGHVSGFPTSYRYNIDGSTNVLHMHSDQTFSVFDEEFYAQPSAQFHPPTKYTSVSDIMTNYFQPKFGKTTIQPPTAANNPKAELNKLIDDKGFKYTLTNDEGGTTFEDSNGSSIVSYPKLGTLNYWNAKTKHLEQFYTVDSALEYLKYNLSPSATKYTSPDWTNPITIKPSWVPPKAFQLMEKGKYQYDGPVPGHSASFRYRTDSGDIIWMHPNNTYTVFDKKINSGKSEQYDVDGFLEYLQEKFGSLPGGSDTNEDVANHIDSTLTNLGLIEPTGAIASPNKIEAIKYLKSFVEKKSGKSVSLTNTKNCIENYSWFLIYVKTHGLPPMQSTDNTLYYLSDFSMHISKPRLEPTGYTYKTTSDESNAKLIRLNLHDETLLKECGFVWTPEDNAYYKDPVGRLAKCYSTGHADLIDTNVETNPFDTIPEMLKYIVQQYGPESSIKQGSSGSTMQKDITTERLEKLGFVASPYQFHSFTKKVVYPPQGTIFHIVTLNPADESMKYQILVGSDKSGYTPMSEHNFDSISAGLSTLEGWMGTESPSKIPPMAFGGTNYVKDPKSHTSMKLDLNEELILKQLGFIYKTGKDISGDSIHWYYNVTGEQINFKENGNGGYWDVSQKYTSYATVKDLMQFLWDKHHTQKATPKATSEVPYSGADYVRISKKDGIQPSFSIILNDQDEKTLMDMGYVRKKRLGHPSPYQMSYDNGKSRMFFHADGTADFWKTEHGKTASFDLFREAMQFLWDIHGPTGTPKASPTKTATGEMPFSGFDYVKLFKDSGTTPSHSVALNYKDEQVLKIIGYEIFNVSSIDSPYNTAYAKGSERMFFYANGTAKYYPNEHGYTKEFATFKEAMQFLWDKTAKLSHTKSATGEMPFSRYNYANLWKQQLVPKDSSISLVDYDEDTLEKLGFRQVVDSGAKVYKKGTAGMVFYADGTARYYPNMLTAQHPTQFASVQIAMEFLWNKHSLFIEEKLTYKSMMRSMLE